MARPSALSRAPPRTAMSKPRTSTSTEGGLSFQLGTKPAQAIDEPGNIHECMRYVSEMWGGDQRRSRLSRFPMDSGPMGQRSSHFAAANNALGKSSPYRLRPERAAQLPTRYPLAKYHVAIQRACRVGGGLPSGRTAFLLCFPPDSAVPHYSVHAQLSLRPSQNRACAINAHGSSQCLSHAIPTGISGLYPFNPADYASALNGLRPACLRSYA